MMTRGNREAAVIFGGALGAFAGYAIHKAMSGKPGAAWPILVGTAVGLGGSAIATKGQSR